LAKGLNYNYSHTHAVNAPSKLTATQLKGRLKDVEVAENTIQAAVQHHSFRKPAFIESRLKATDYGNAFHAYVQYVNFDNCLDAAGVEAETTRLLQAGILTQCQSEAIRSEDILTFVYSPLGVRMRQSKNILREFKFSILDDSAKYTPGTNGESVLLQGVVDCALIEPEGITIIDFKTDQVNDDNLMAKVEEYRHQVRTYAHALSRIFELPILEIYLYFSRINQAIQVTL
jgi:ATP-dependent helicase/nuclease subunit A